MLRPAAFKYKKPGDPEQLLQDFMLYKTMMDKFFLATAAAVHGVSQGQVNGTVDWGPADGQVV